MHDRTTSASVPGDTAPRTHSADPPGARPATRIVLLGASNLTWSFPHLMGRLESSCPGPVHVFAAHGHGRSYGIWSRVVVRALPAIIDCRLWQDFQRCADESTPTLALVTDIGNDLIYGVPVEQIVEWVECCLQRLTAFGAETVITLLPMASLERLSAIRYHLTKLVFFPGKSASWPEMLSRARELNQRIEETGRRFDAQVVVPASEWYGFDPIHIRRSRRPEAWSTIFSHWSAFDPRLAAATIRSVAGVRWWLHAPAERRLFGRRRTAAQPAARTPNAVLHLY